LALAATCSTCLGFILSLPAAASKRQNITCFGLICSIPSAASTASKRQKTPALASFFPSQQQAGTASKRQKRTPSLTLVLGVTFYTGYNLCL